MVNIVDLSRRRGAIVHLLPQVYELLQKSGHGLPNRILWTQGMRKAVVEINRKWIFALEGTYHLRGLMFYHLGADGKSLYLDAFEANNTKIFELLITKFSNDSTVKNQEIFYIGRNIRREAAEEMLESVGLQDDSVYDDDGYQNLGGLAETVKALKLRYLG